MTVVNIKIVDYATEIAAIKAIRKQVFQIEQKVAEKLEFDGLDETATHLLAYLENQPVGTTRIRTIDSQTAKIERLSVLPVARKQGIGQQLMLKAIAIIQEQNYQLIVVHAQEYIKNMYQKLGFEQVGNTFTEAKIAHVKMIKKLL